MTIITHTFNDLTIAELLSDEIFLSTLEDGTDLLGNLYYEGFDKIILHTKNMNPDFFDLKNGMAGELLQKFSNFRMSLAIVGDFSTFTSKSLHEFILESNKGKLVNFVARLDDAIAS